MTRTWPAFLIDAIVISLFTTFGILAHHGDMAAYLSITWPFWAALCLAWLIPIVNLRAFPLWPAGFLTWGITVIAGAALRCAFTNRPLTGSFLLAAAGFLALGLLGWRLIYQLVGARRARSAGSKARTARPR